MDTRTFDFIEISKLGSLTAKKTYVVRKNHHITSYTAILFGNKKFFSNFLFVLCFSLITITNSCNSNIEIDNSSEFLNESNDELANSETLVCE
jgi:hypothetical protein